MKKYCIVLAALLLLSLFIVCFSVPDRIAYHFKGMGSYNMEKYDKIITDLPATEITIDFSVYNNEPVTIYQHNEHVYLTMDRIKFEGDAFTFYFTSHGKSTFHQGDLICFRGTSSTKVSNEYGDFFFSITGESPMENETTKYYYALYPIKEGMVSSTDFANMRITIPISNLGLCHFERK